MCIVTICYPACDVISFKIKLSFLIKLFSYMVKNSGQKFKYLANDELLTWIKKHFSSILQGFQSLEIILDLKVDL